MNSIHLVRFHLPAQGTRIGCQIDHTVYDLTDKITSVAAWLKSSVGRAPQAIAELEALAQNAASTLPAAQLQNAPAPDNAYFLAPVDHQDVWAAGVTYERSRQARQEEAIDGGDVYARVYDAPRPELFFKAQGKNVVGHLHEVGIRADSKWNVPEPELGLVINPALEVVGFTVGNDMSSRDIEGENPLYLPQAKVYTASCALGQGLLLQPAQEWLQTTIRIQIERGGRTAFEGAISTSRIKRAMRELVEYLGRSTTFPDGAVLLTGTGIVPPNDFTLAVGDVITITIDGVSTLQNRVKVV